ncbi:MAG: RNA polymerase sigma factor [bacterium]|nr:RNA polymerase sigma factor [bacterium]
MSDTERDTPETPDGPPHELDGGAALMLAWRSGDETAFERLVEGYSGRVYALLTRFLGRHTSREDLVQEVFLRVIRSRDRYEPTARFLTWLYRIVYNLAVNETQRGRPKELVSLDASAPGEDDVRRDVHDEDAPDPAQRLERADVVLAVRAAIEELPDNQRMALVLAKYHEMPYVEIAEILSSSEKAIKSLIHRARTTLRANLAPFLAEEL